MLKSTSRFFEDSSKIFYGYDEDEDGDEGSETLMRIFEVYPQKSTIFEDEDEDTFYYMFEDDARTRIT